MRTKQDLPSDDRNKPKREHVRGMSVYCDKCNKHTSVDSIVSGSFSVLRLVTHCCNTKI